MRLNVSAAPEATNNKKAHAEESLIGELTKCVMFANISYHKLTGHSSQEKFGCV